MDRLRTDEIGSFKREGYLIKRGVMDPDQMARAPEAELEGAPDRMKRDDSTTWFGPFREDEEVARVVRGDAEGARLGARF